MKKSLVRLSIALASVMLTILSSFANEGRGNGRVRILDGRTLDDFESIPKLPKSEVSKAFSISNGIMYAAGNIDTLLVTKESYSNFNLSFDVCYPEDGFGDGGISLFVQTLPDRTDIYTGLEIQINPTFHVRMKNPRIS